MKKSAKIPEYTRKKGEMHATSTHRSKSQDAGLAANKLSQVHLDIPKTLAGEPIYTGNVANAIRNGDGKYDYLLGGNHLYKYEGNYEDGKKSKSGKFIVRDYCEYQGEFDKNEITGKGTKKWNDGRLYIGEFLNGEMNGKGKFISSNQKEVYEGMFLDNKRHGNGIYTVKNDETSIYQGTGVFVKESKFCASSNSFNNNCIHGHTTITWNKLAQYEGSILNGALQGAGYLRALDSSYEYDGDFDDNLPTDLSVGGYLHSELDRSNIKVDEAPKDPKAKAPPPKKGAEVASDIVVPAGGELGNLVIRAGRALTPEEIESLKAAATAPPAKGAKAPEGPTEINLKPIPIANALPRELMRTVNITLKKVLNDDVAAKQFSDEIYPLWVRRKTIEEYVSEPSRFPARSIVYCNDKLSSVIPAPHPPIFQAGTTITDSTHGSTAIKALLIGSESTCTVSTTKNSLSRGAEESITYLIDFKLNLGQQDESSTREIALFQLTNSVSAAQVRLYLIPVNMDKYAQGIITCNWELRLDSTVISSWHCESEIDLNLYHSLCVCVNKTTASIDLFVDGGSKMKSASAWVNEEVECCCLAEPDTPGAPVSNNSAEECGEAVVSTPKTLSMIIGGENSNFTGFVRTLVIAARDDRLDPVTSTAYYATYTRNEGEWNAAKENEKGMSQEDASNNTESLPTIPFEYIEVPSVQTTLVCGSGNNEIIAIPSATLNGYYAVCISDGVNSDLLAAADNCRRSPDDRPDIPPSALEYAVKCVKQVDSSYLIIKVEKI